MKHLNNALQTVNDSKFKDFVSIEGNELRIKIQDGVIPEVGVNGIQVSELLAYVNEIFKSLNTDYPCRENSLTITKIEEALHWQEARTKDRLMRNVEGTYTK